MLGPAFALEEAARDLAGSGGFLTVVDGQGEEIEPFAGLGPDDGGQDDGLAVLDPGSRVGLLGNLAGFDAELATCDLTFHSQRRHIFLTL